MEISRDVRWVEACYNRAAPIGCRAEEPTDRERMEEHVSVLIIAQSAQLRSSLQVLLTAIPRIGEVTQADTLATARRVHPTHPPTLVVWEVPPCNREAQDARPQIKALWPQSQCLLLVDDEQGQRAAEPAGTETVLVKGTLAAKFLATVETLLTPRQTDAPTPAEESV